MANMTGESMDILQENIKSLRQLFPEVCCEDKIDFDKLKQILGEYVDDSKQRYDFTWNGKGEAIKLSQTTSMGTLRPCPCEEESKNWNDTENLYIEGDNLEVLKLLQKSYYKQIKMIYIDPPYNTGKDFIYPDNYKDNIENYKEITGQVDEEGQNLSTNKETDGRFHTKWLNMMYPRLRLARNLLKDDGVIFISIDDKEVTNLKKICDEIFGENNLIGIGQWRRVEGKPGKSKFMGKTSEFVLIYARYISDFSIGLLPLTKEALKEFRYKDEKGKFRRGQIYYPNRGSYYYSVTTPYGNEIVGDFTIEKEDFDEYNRKNMIYWAEKGEHTPYLKIYLDDFKGTTPINTFGKEFGSTQSAIKEHKKLFDTKKEYFDNPKPTKLLNKLLLISNTKENDIVLDFFSGSATTAHAVMQLNAEDGGNRKFICVQFPEPCDKKKEAFNAGYKNICEIGKERIRRAGEKIKEEIENNNTQLKIGEDKKSIPDIGFKVFKLDTSNIKKWQGNNIDDIEQVLLNSVDNFVADRSQIDVVYEVMLKLGLKLSEKLELCQVKDSTIYYVKNASLMICLSNNIDIDIANKMIELYKKHKPQTWKVVVKDNGFEDDSIKTSVVANLEQAGLDRDAFISI